MLRKSLLFAFCFLNSELIVHAVTCNFYVAPTGADSNPGTLASPWQTAQKAFNSAAAGQTVCFRGGTYPETVVPNPTTQTPSQLMSNSGAAGNPITFTNYPGEVAIIQGETKIYGSYITFTGTPQAVGSCSAANLCGLIFERTDSVAYAGDIDILNSSGPGFVTIDHVEIRHGPYHAGIYQEGCNNAIIGSYVHDNGWPNPLGNTENNGIYWSALAPCANGGLVANNVVEHNNSCGINMYAGGSNVMPSHVTVTENTIVDNGNYGICLWGDNNVVVNNILYSNGDAVSSAQATMDAGASQTVDYNVTWDTTSTSGNRATWWNNDPQCTGASCITNNKVADPLFLNSSSKDWHLTSNSPAIGWSNTSYVQSVDKDNVSRSSRFDAGAYQYTGSTSTLSPCDTNGDGQTNIVDVQMEVNMALKVIPCPPANSCSVVGVQRVVNAVLGGACVAP